MKKSYNKAFTLVELLAVIVILAIILVIAVPKIMDVINSSKKSTLETSVKMIASAAEKIKMQNTVLGKEDEDITCSSVAKLNSNDYDLDNCTITFDSNNNASVTIKGKGKFDGLYVCGGTKTQATAQTEICTTDEKYFSYEVGIDEDTFVYSAEVVDMEKCIGSIVYAWDISNEKAQAICNNDLENGNGWNLQQNVTYLINYGYGLSEMGLKGTYKKITNVEITNKDSCDAYLTNLWEEEYYDEYIEPICSGGTDSDGKSIDYYIRTGGIAVEDFETAGLNVEMEDRATTHVAIITSYNIKGGLDVIIPSTIDGYTVVGISEHAFYYKNIKSVVIPNTVTTIGYEAFYDNNITNIIIPSSVTSISNNAFAGNPLTKVYLENPNIEIGNCIFGNIEDIEEHNISYPYKCAPS